MFKEEKDVRVCAWKKTNLGEDFFLEREREVKPRIFLIHTNAILLSLYFEVFFNRVTVVFSIISEDDQWERV